MTLALGGAMRPAKANAFIDNNFRAQGINEPRLFVVCHKQTRAIMGFAGYMDISDEVGSNEVEFGFVLASEFQHRGYGAEIAHALVKYGLGIRQRLFARCHPENKASIGILKGHLHMKRIRRPRRDTQPYGPRLWYVTTGAETAACSACETARLRRLRDDDCRVS